ncbi:bifunctional hydroxymethylpyrimidine kinase/phosphomethylpyrimidine kinase [Tritonibacter scottomollicae]|uniref:hydroxymethylpyrimidine kinase n=1 Tax=Tritonibacter scottomollicae TaxID=483013 RepID=A0ABZ0HF29_TRISK|nr:bifunctional hydroxymethylpyrimidine kinase/phosphomethylpyrimidine kinase [Tritonibacter scottomollicae]WOI33428.1 bifunctional hydroxymethylpyrimidine kinase/phosphomethylpyrimidine kinase [Tritonibacter scottomollicae]
MAHIALTIAGSDSGGGAGIQADLKTMSALGVYGASVITAITAQNTQAVTGVHGIPLDMITAQIDAVLSDLDVGAIKIGMLATPEIIDCVARAIADFDGAVVLDPVMIAKSGDALLAPEAVSTLCRVLLPRARIITPNLPEAACLLDRPTATSAQDMVEQGRALCALGAQAVLMKGGHAEGEICEDILIEAGAEIARFSAARQHTKNTHGTGCTLSSAIAAGLAKGLSLDAAVSEAHGYLQGAIAAADDLQIGHGHGPVHHFHRFWPA